MGKVSKEEKKPSMQLLEFISGTSHRWKILEVVADDPKNLRCISSELDIPRTTLRHNLRKMVEEGVLVENLNNEYRANSLGQSILLGIESYRKRVETTLKLEPLFECISPTDFDVEITAFADAEITVASQVTPHAPVQTLIDKFRDGTNICGFTPMLPLVSDGEILDLLDSEEVEFEAVLTTDVVEVLQRDYELELGELLKKEGVDISITDQSMEYGLLVIDGLVIILGLDENGKPHVLVEAENDACRSWAMQEFEACRENATSYPDDKSSSIR